VRLHGDQLDAVVARHAGLGQRVADVLIAVGDQHEALLRIVGEAGRGQLHGLRDVREVAAGLGLPLLQQALVHTLLGQQLDVGVGAEVDLAEGVVLLHRRERLLELGVDGRQVGVVDGVAVVAHDHDADAVGEAHELRAGQREDEQDPDDDTQDQADPLLVGPERGIARADAQPVDHRQGQQQQEPRRAGELKHVLLWKSPNHYSKNNQTNSHSQISLTGPSANPQRPNWGQHNSKEYKRSQGPEQVPSPP
jgi:hypothetical protein